MGCGTIKTNEEAENIIRVKMPENKTPETPHTNTNDLPEKAKEIKIEQTPIKTPDLNNKTEQKKQENLNENQPIEVFPLKDLDECILKNILEYI